MVKRTIGLNGKKGAILRAGTQLLGLSILTFALGCATPSANFDTAPSIEVSGSAEISAPPNIARFKVVIISEDKDAMAAAKDNAARSEKVNAAIAEGLAGTGTVSTSSYAVSPRYRWDKDEGRQTLIGHTARNSLEVETRNLTSVGALADAALAAGANSIEGMVFTLEDPTELKAISLALAAGRARIKAAAMANGLGLKLGRVLHVEERGGAPTPHLRAMTYARTQESDTTPIHPGAVDIRSEVLIRIEVGPKD